MLHHGLLAGGGGAAPARELDDLLNAQILDVVGDRVHAPRLFLLDDGRLRPHRRPVLSVLAQPPRGLLLLAVLGPRRPEPAQRLHVVLVVPAEPLVRHHHLRVAGLRRRVPVPEVALRLVAQPRGAHADAPDAVPVPARGDRLPAGDFVHVGGVPPPPAVLGLREDDEVARREPLAGRRAVGEEVHRDLAHERRGDLRRAPPPAGDEPLAVEEPVEDGPEGGRVVVVEEGPLRDPREELADLPAEPRVQDARAAADEPPGPGREGRAPHVELHPRVGVAEGADPGRPGDLLADELRDGRVAEVDAVAGEAVVPVPELEVEAEELERLHDRADGPGDGLPGPRAAALRVFSRLRSPPGGLPPADPGGQRGAHVVPRQHQEPVPVDAEVQEGAGRGALRPRALLLRPPRRAPHLRVHLPAEDLRDEEAGGLDRPQGGVPALAPQGLQLTEEALKVRLARLRDGSSPLRLPRPGLG
mmetsp:Transcript_15647/g.38583  ORF Transcript_15647/g.38583 Transcript_15647/m.38583 type:complete len:473 (+) Transcript_15647:1158-2576(+)